MAGKRNRFSEITGNALLAVLLLIFCFPRLEPVTGAGIDPPLLWAYNHFFVNGIQSGVDVIFTHGPLAFLILPLDMGNNYILALILTSLAYFLFFYSFLELGRHLHEGKWMLPAMILLIVGHLVPMVYLLTGLTVCCILLYHEKRQIAWLIIAAFSAVFGFYIKAGFGFLALFPVFSYAAIYFLRYKKLTVPVICTLGPAIAYILTWLACYGNLKGLGTFLYATYELARGNSNGAALYPQNDWILVGSAIVCIAAIPFLVNQRRIYLVYALFALSFFGTWKHGFSREDSSHVRGSIVFLIMAMAFVLVYLRHARPLHLVLISAAPVLLYMNVLFFVDERQPYSISTMRFVNFYDQVLNTKEHLKKYKKVSLENLRGSKLDDVTRQLIGSKTVDIYPFDFSFVPANGLNWKPRPVLQTYASYTTWLDRQNAEHFNSAEAPEFILWHLSGDMHGQLTGIDNRCVLNDEPAGLLTILRNYKLVRKTDRIMLFQKTGRTVLGQPKDISMQEGKWEEWIDVPQVKDGILRVKLKTRGTLLRSVKSFLYKDGAFFAEYRLANGEVRKFRIILSNAEDGVWVNPLVVWASGSERESPVTQIRFLCSDLSLMKEKVELTWQHIPTLTQGNHTTDFREAFLLFGKEREPRVPILHSRNDFDSASAAWPPGSHRVLEKSREAKSTVYRLDTILFSPGFTISLDTFMKKDSILNIYASVRCSMPWKSEAKLVVSIKDSTGNQLFWDALHMNYFVTEYDRWEYVYMQRDLPAGLPPSATLTATVWNVGTKPILIDDMEVKLYKKARTQ